MLKSFLSNVTDCFPVYFGKFFGATGFTPVKVKVRPLEIGVRLFFEMIDQMLYN